MNPETQLPDRGAPVSLAGSTPGWPEVIVGPPLACVLLFILWIYLFSPFYSASEKFRLRIQLGNMRELYAAAKQMAVDEGSSKDPAFGWPGDTGSSFASWAAHLVKGGYLMTYDLVGMLSTAGPLLAAE